MPPSNDLTLPQALQLAQQHLARGQLQLAENLYRQILSVDPQQPQATHGLGLVALYARNAEPAIQLLTRSTQLQPTNAVAHLDLGNAYLSFGRLEKAVAAYRQALALKPDFAGVYSNLGVALHELGKIDESIECFRRAAALGPKLPDAHTNLGNALKSLGRFDEAIAAYRKAIELRPDWAEAQNNLAAALKESGLIDEAIAACRRALELKPSFAGAHSNLASFLSFDPSRTAQEIFDEHRRWDQQHALGLKPQNPHYPNDRSPSRPLRIGYVSPDFRDHSVSYFFEGLLAAHSKTQVEIFCYADLQRRPDPTTTRLKQHADHWRDIIGQTDAAIAETIRKDYIDILVDLAGHYAGNRLLVFARKPAPLQISYLGYPNTTGLTAIDYFLCDPYTDPVDETDPFYSEQLIRLPGTFATYRPPDDAPQVGPLPALASCHVTFASFNAIAKINDNVLACWAEILKASDNSRLLLVAQGLGQSSIANRMREVFDRHEVSADRLEFSGSLSRRDYLATHHRVDILLDTFPVNGHTITCHALWMGVPVVTLADKMHCGRLSASVLHNLGLSDWVTETMQDYIDAAVSLAGDVSHLSELRANLRQTMQRSPLMNHRALAGNIEKTYRNIWHQWLQGGPNS